MRTWEKSYSAGKGNQRHGVKPRYGKVWHESAIRKILTNKTYYGALEYSTKRGGEVLIENIHQPLTLTNNTKNAEAS